jgi:2,3-bisphosphoglycerate-dependent phosphoglycerate mutase
MSILLVRHGETAGNADRVMQTADVPLNERGRQQAERLTGRLAALGFDAIVSSDLARARMTAESLSARSGVEVEELPLLQERNFGDLRGMPYESLGHNSFDPDFVPPNGESWDAFHARVAEAFAFVVRRRRELRGHLVVVTHGLVCRAIVARHAHLAGDLAAPAGFDNTSLTVLDAAPPHRVRRLNCTEHLATALGQGSDHGAA